MRRLEMKMKKIVILISAISVLLLAAHGVIFAKEESAKGKENVFHAGDIMYSKPVKGVIFSHKAHVDEKGLSCEMCHSGLFEPSALKAQEKSDFNMNSLYKGKYCGVCHNGKTAFASDTQCARCHAGVTGYKAYEKMKPASASAYGPKSTMTMGKGDTAVKFNHENHMQYSTCSDCHSKGFAMGKGKTKIAMSDLYQGKYCGSCHNGKKAFVSTDCAKCHTNIPAPKADLTYSAKGAGAVKFSHNFHTKMFKCDDCHSKVFTMKKGGSKVNMDGMYKGQFCGKCHDGKTATAVTDCGKCHKG